MNSLAWGIVNCATKHCQYAEEIASFVHQNPQRSLSHRKLYHILGLFEKWWIFVGRYSSEPFEQYILHYIAERSFWSDLRDGEYVAKLLVFLYQADNHFGFFLCPEVDCYPPLVSFNGSSNHLAQYFLNHAYQKQLTISGRRIADVEVFCRSIWLHPCEMAVITECPVMLRMLLQYGSLITDEVVSLRRFRSYPAAGNILVITMCILKTIIEVHQTELIDDTNTVAFKTQKFNDMIQCARLMMRVSPQFEKSTMFQMTLEFPGFASTERALSWLAQNGVPELQHRVFSPMGLKHACRLKIRKQLHDSWQLPHGIKELHIPEILKGFINLDSD